MTNFIHPDPLGSTTNFFTIPRSERWHIPVPMRRGRLAGLLALSALVEFVGFAIWFLSAKVALVKQSSWSLRCFDETVYLGIIDRLAGAGVLIQNPDSSVLDPHDVQCTHVNLPRPPPLLFDTSP